MARPRRVEQDVVLDRIEAALAQRRGVSPWTLAEVAPAAGLSPAGLVKRFGSRRQILVNLSERWIASVPQAAGQGEPLQELRSWAAVRFASRDPHGTAQGLIQLLDDLADDELRALLARGWARERAYVATLLGAADLPRLGDPAVAATLVVDVLNGAMLRAAADPMPDAVGRALDELLEVWT